MLFHERLVGHASWRVYVTSLLYFLEFARLKPQYHYSTFEWFYGHGSEIVLYSYTIG
jgi:hypothetical protein